MASQSTQKAVPAPLGAYGFHHPATEDELAATVKMAYEQKRQCRVRGAAHSVAHAIYADPLGGLPNRVDRQRPPPAGNVEIMLDRYRGWRVRDESRKLVEADAGIHLGPDRGDPTRTATRATSLLWQLQQKGWMFSNLGGITQQTVSGFTATGSSGGSAMYSVNDNLWGFRVHRPDRRSPRVLARRPEPRPLLCDVTEPRPARRGVGRHLQMRGHVQHHRTGVDHDDRGLRDRPLWRWDSAAAVRWSGSARGGVCARVAGGRSGEGNGCRCGRHSGSGHSSASVPTRSKSSTPSRASSR